MANILVTMTKKQTLSQLKTNHLCLLCESKSLQAFTSLSLPGRVISRQSHSKMWFRTFLPAFCHLFSPHLLGLITHYCTTWCQSLLGSHRLWLLVELIPYTSAESLDLSSRSGCPAVQWVSFVGPCLMRLWGKNIPRECPRGQSGMPVL